MLRLALYQPDIPQNAGAMIRLAACLGAAIEIIEPAGFILDAARIRRVHMDYIDLVNITRHAGLEALRAAYPARPNGPRLLPDETSGSAGAQPRHILLAPQGDTSVWDFNFAPDDILIMGPESKTTLPELIAHADMVLRIPMVPGARSLNVASAAAIALGEAKRQCPSA
jgi:tRNA (cytidine/uridine-2'-O-)-methyltransferase